MVTFLVLLVLLIACVCAFPLQGGRRADALETNAKAVPSLNVTAGGDPDNPFIDYVANFSSFRDGITHALQKSGDLTGAPCFIPNSAVVFTLSNHHLFPLLALRHRIMDKANITYCQQQRFITVCLDRKCLSQCENSGFMNCVYLKVPETVYSEFGRKDTAYQKNSYNYIVWVKYEMFVEALMVANEVFYFDADVMLFGNPYPEAQFGRDETGKKIPGPYEVMYQRERGMKELGCGGSVNGGLFYLRNSTGMHERFLPTILKHRADIINLTGRLDQDIVGDYVRLVKYCTLPVNRFMGYCVPSQDANGYDPKQIVTFHTNCVSGMHNKMDTIRNFAVSYFGHSV